MGISIRWRFVLIAVLIALIVGLAAYWALPRLAHSEWRQGGVYVEGIAGFPQALNPLLCQYNDVDRDISSLIFEGLTDFDERGAVAPRLAERWDISSDGLTYTFYLRRDVQWHDGAPFTADDVLFTVQVMQDADFLALDASGVFDRWTSVKAEKVDDYTVRFVLAEPYAPFLDDTTVGILPAHLLSRIEPRLLPKAQFNSQPVGTGPFRIDSVTAGQVTLKPHLAYYGEKPRLESVVFRFYPDAESLWSAYDKGEIAGISQVPPSAVARARANHALKLYSARLSKYTMIVLNLADAELPFFQQVEVRQALLWGLDRQALVNRVLGGQALVAHSPVVSDTWAYNPDIVTYTYDPDRARQLLEQAGWTDRDGDGVRERGDRRLQFTLATSDDPTWTRVAQEVSRQWADIGVQAIPETVSFPKLVGEFLYPRRFEAVLIALEYAGDPDPYPLWHSSQANSEGQNWSGFAHPRVDAILEEARRVPDGARRVQLYREFQEIFAEHVPALLLYYPIYYYAIDAKVQNVHVAPMNDSSDRFRTITQWYIWTKGE